MTTAVLHLNRILVRTTLGAALLAAAGVQGATTDISPAPLASSSSASVLPNLMFVLDDSGSMDFDYLPDFVDDDDTCKERDGDDTDCNRGDPPFNSSQFNGVYYNPLVTYKPAVNYDGTSMGAQASPWTAVKNDAFNTGLGTINLTNGFREIAYCSDAAGNYCKRNGVDTIAGFEYRTNPTANNDTGRRYGYPETQTIQLWSGNLNASGSNSISKSGSTVTIILALNSPITDNLGVNDTLQISGGSCGNAYSNGGVQVATASTTASTVTMTYANGTSNSGSGNRNCTIRRVPYNRAKNITVAPYYYTITPKEYCSSSNLTTCVASTTSVGVNTFPAPVRYCNSAANANLVAPVSDPSTSPRCQAKYTTTFKYPRYGNFTRTNIVSGSFTGRPNRVDCAAAPTCTYAEEMTNFANWHAYYRTRMQMMKTSAGQAFLPIDNRYRVGFLTINPTCTNGTDTCGSSVKAEKYLKIAKFEPSQKQSWYTKFYGQLPRNGTPLRTALSRVGRHFGGKTTGLNSGMPDDPVEYSCQQNFTILTTDGYWNGDGGQNLSGNSIANFDNNQTIAPPPMWDGGTTGSTTTTTVTTTYSQGPIGAGSGCTGAQVLFRKVQRRVVTSTTVTPMSGSVALASTTTTNGPTGVVTFQGTCQLNPAVPANPAPVVTTTTSGVASGGTSDTLADVAAYYYQTDLRATGATGALGSDVSKNNVPTSPKDSAAYQHMTTFSLGIVDGLMTYRPDYETAAAGDYANVRNSTNNACFWVTGPCVWPTPAADSLSALDDLWHAATNGRGTFYQAKDPTEVASGLSNALAGMNAHTAAAAASATSSPNITPTDNAIFSSTYTTVEWAGQVIKRTIDTQTGEVSSTINWSAQSLLDAKVGTTTDTRNIHMFSALGTNKLKAFDWAGMTAAEQAFFTNKCTPSSNLTQCITLTAPQLVVANNGQNVVNFLRGRSEQEGEVYRDRSHVLGDTVNATPAYMREPRFAFGDAVTPDYTSFKLDNKTRQATLFIAANDGMMHAFNADNGQEMWAYVPKMVMPNLYKLTDTNYAAKHQYFADGSPELMDIHDGSKWRTIMVSGLNSGGRGYYALDVTDPTAPKGLWEFCSDSTLCAIADTDLGLTYGNATITKRPQDGKWVVIVTSGYNNVSPGTGKAFIWVLDALTGAVLAKVDTGFGDTTTPAGLAKLAAWADEGNVNNTALYLYGGDLRGNVWRFDMAFDPPKVMKLGVLTAPSARVQSVTTKPELAEIQGHRVVYVGTGRYLGTSDLQDPNSWVPSSTDAYQQTMYAIKDSDAELGLIRSDSTMVEQKLSIIDDSTRSSSSKKVDWNANNGWFIDFNPSDESPGERVNIDPQLVLGTLLVVTNVPNTDACTIGGDSWLYQFNYTSGQFLLSAPNNAVARKLGNAITVGIVVVQLPGGSIKVITTDAGGGQDTGGVNIGGGSPTGRRMSWREMFHIEQNQ